MNLHSVVRRSNLHLQPRTSTAERPGLSLKALAEQSCTCCQRSWFGWDSVSSFQASRVATGPALPLLEIPG